MSLQMKLILVLGIKEAEETRCKNDIYTHKHYKAAKGVNKHAAKGEKGAFLPPG